MTPFLFIFWILVMICFIINSYLLVVNVMQLDDWVLCRIYKKNSSAQKVEANLLAMECSNGSSPSSSSHVDDMLESLPEIDDRCFTLPRVNSVRTTTWWGHHRPRRRFKAVWGLNRPMGPHVFSRTQMPDCYRARATHLGLGSSWVSKLSSGLGTEGSDSVVL